VSGAARGLLFTHSLHAHIHTGVVVLAAPRVCCQKTKQNIVHTLPNALPCTSAACPSPVPADADAVWCSTAASHTHCTHTFTPAVVVLPASSCVCAKRTQHIVHVFPTPCPAHLLHASNQSQLMGMQFGVSPKTNPTCSGAMCAMCYAVQCNGHCRSTTKQNKLNNATKLIAPTARM
jgi:hypothetical protein